MSDELDPNAINLYSEKSTRCPQKVYAEMHQKCPVARLSLTNSPVIARYEDVVWALRHPCLVGGLLPQSPSGRW